MIQNSSLDTFLIKLICWSGLFFSAQLTAQNKDCVILLHGLTRSHYSMVRLELTLKKHDYWVVNHNYPSTQKNIFDIANHYIPSMINECLSYHPKRIHFVTHSLGGIILQRYLQNNSIASLDSIVMLGPPNHGSPFADFLANNRLLKIFLGPSITDLTTHDKDIPLKAGHYKIGIIAGNYTLNPFGKWIFKEENDGKVAVSSTKIAKMNDFIVLPVSHTFMMRNALVEKQVLAFLNQGRFAK